MEEKKKPAKKEKPTPAAAPPAPPEITLSDVMQELRALNAKIDSLSKKSLYTR